MKLIDRFFIFIKNPKRYVQYGEAKLTLCIYIEGVNFASPYCIVYIITYECECRPFLTAPSSITFMNSHNLSFADRDASRKRMGLSQHVLTLIEKTGANFARGDSSETEEQCRQRCKSYVITVI